MSHAMSPISTRDAGAIRRHTVKGYKKGFREPHTQAPVCGRRVAGLYRKFESALMHRAAPEAILSTMDCIAPDPYETLIDKRPRSWGKTAYKG